MTALDVADGDGSRGHESGSAIDFRAERRFVGTRRHFATDVPRNVIDSTGNFIRRWGPERCIKLLAAWLLRPTGPYNCRFPEQN